MKNETQSRKWMDREEVLSETSLERNGMTCEQVEGHLTGIGTTKAKIAYLSDILERSNLLAKNTQTSVTTKLAESYEKNKQFHNAKKVYSGLECFEGVVRNYFREETRDFIKIGANYDALRDISGHSDYLFRKSLKEGNSLSVSHRTNALARIIYEFVKNHEKDISDPETLRKLKNEALESILQLPEVSGKLAKDNGEYENLYAYLEGDTLEYLRELGGEEAVKRAYIKNAELAEKRIDRVKFDKINAYYYDRDYYAGKIEGYEGSEYCLNRALRSIGVAKRYKTAGQFDLEKKFRKQALEELAKVSEQTRKLANYKDSGYSYDFAIEYIEHLEEGLKDRLGEGENFYDYDGILKGPNKR